jgi:hypothetical protein
MQSASNLLKYRICCDVELPARMQGEIAYGQAFEMVCDWNDSHEVKQMAWLERCDAGGSNVA